MQNWRFVDLRDERRHQLAIADRPGRGSAHSLMGEITAAVEVGAVECQLDGVDHRLARNQPNQSQQSLRAKAVTPIKDFQPHRRPYPFSGCVGHRRKRAGVLAVRLADGSAHHDLEDLVLAQTRGADRGDVLVSHAVGAVGHLSIKVRIGSLRPALSKAARRSSGGAVPSLSSTRATSARCSWVMSDMVGGFLTVIAHVRAGTWRCPTHRCR